MRASPIIVVALFLAACPDKPTSGLPDAEPFMGEDLPTCTPECSGRTCGLDPICGRSCGSCDSDETCSAAGACVQNCTPGCGARQCGVDDCGTSCGTCGTGSTCEQMTGACVETVLRIEGVTIPNASVAVTVSSSQFSTTADAMGVYAIELGMQSNDSMVVVRARGIGAEDFVELASIAGDIASLSANGGADHVVTVAEDHGVVVNPISTANYAGYFAANGGHAPATRAELDTAEEDFDEALTSWESFLFASAIRFVIDGTAPMLPASHPTTLALAEDLPAMWAYVNPLTFIPETGGSLLDPASEELWQDPTTAVDITDLAPDTHFQDFMKKRNGFPGDLGGRLELVAGGQGSAQPRWSAPPIVPQLSAFTWSIDQKTLKIEYTRAVDNGLWFLDAQGIVDRLGDPSRLAEITAALEPLGGGVDVRAEVLGEERVFTSRGKKIDTVIVRAKKRWHLDEALGPVNVTVPAVDRLETPTGEHLRKESSIVQLPLAREEILGTWALSLVVPIDLDDYFGVFTAGAPMLVDALINFHEDGSATAIFGLLRTMVDLTWTLGGDGQLTINLPNGNTQTAAKLVETGGLVGILTTYQIAGGARYTHYGREGKADPALMFDAEMLASNASEYWQTSVYAYYLPGPDGGPTTENVFGWIFESGEIATRLLGDIDTGMTTRDETWNWRLRDGVVEVEQRTDQNHNMRCTYDDPSCIALRRRTWTPLTLANGRFTVLELDTYLKERTGVRTGAIVWDPMRELWINPMTGAVARNEERLYLIEPRAQAYVALPIP